MLVYVPLWCHSRSVALVHDLGQPSRTYRSGAARAVSLQCTTWPSGRARPCTRAAKPYHRVRVTSLFPLAHPQPCSPHEGSQAWVLFSILQTDPHVLCARMGAWRNVRAGEQTKSG